MIGIRPCRSVRRIGQIDIDVIDRANALAVINTAVESREPMMVAFCNAHTVNMAERNHAMARALSEATLVLNDGIGIDLASRILYGEPFPDNLNGTDFTPVVLDAARRSLRIALVGSAPGVATAAAEILARRYPRHVVVLAQHGFFTAAEEQDVAARIGEARPDLILVGMGHPRQELFAGAHWRRFGAVTMCIGAFIDFTAGRVRRAPPWVVGMRIEWVYRLLTEPRRLAGRYIAGNAIFLAHIMRDRLR